MEPYSGDDLVDCDGTCHTQHPRNEMTIAPDCREWGVDLWLCDNCRDEAR